MLCGFRLSKAVSALVDYRCCQSKTIVSSYYPFLFPMVVLCFPYLLDPIRCFLFRKLFAIVYSVLFPHA